MLACWGVYIPATVVIERAWVMFHPLYLVYGGLAWVVPAALGLLLGSLPFLASKL